MAPSIKGRVSYVAHTKQQENSLTLDALLHSDEENLFDELVQRFAFTSALSGVQPKF